MDVTLIYFILLVACLIATEALSRQKNTWWWWLSPVAGLGAVAFFFAWLLSFA